MKMKHILLIDDNDIDNYVTNHVITKSQRAEKITIKNSGVAALEYLVSIERNATEFPEVIFLDVRMPVMDGFQFLDELIKLSGITNNQCQVVMLSSSSDQSDIDRAFTYSVVKKYLVKPFKIEMLEDL